MSARAALVFGMVSLVGCADQEAAPPGTTDTATPEVLFLVKNEVLAIHLDGTSRRSLGKVGDDRHRTGFPRFLADGRVALLADDTGGIFPYVSARVGSSASGGVAFSRLTDMNVSINDSLCTVTIGGAQRLVFTTTPFTPYLPMSSRMYRVDVDDPKLEPVGFQAAGPDANSGTVGSPAPYDDGRVVVVRTLRPDGLSLGTATIELLRVDRPYEHDPSLVSEKLVTVEAGHLAGSPARLPNGRIVFIQSDPLAVSANDVGEVMVVERNNELHSTGITGVLALEVVEDKLIYEVAGSDNISDLVMTDLVHPPVNLTNTPYASEHLGWSD